MRDTLGEFEHQVLLAILRLGEEAYSVPIVLEIEECTGKRPSQAAVYIVLRRLEEKGLLTSRLDDHAVPTTGRTRRYFQTTPTALRLLKATRQRLFGLWDGLETRLDDVS